jgi:nucleotide-binding universal stress UspA family protein
MFPVASILWPTDTSESSFKALETAVEVAQRFSAVLYALQVVQQVPPLVAGSEFAPMAIKGFDVPLYQQELLKNAENDLQRVIARKIPLGIKVNSEVRIGITADVINEFAQEKNIDLIVMATHGRTGFSRFMIGSVAEKIIRLSTIPTLIIPIGGDDTSA